MFTINIVQTPSGDDSFWATVISYSEKEDKLFEFHDLPGGGTAMSNAVRRRMSSGENFTFKKMTHAAQERFS